MEKYKNDITREKLLAKVGARNFSLNDWLEELSR